MILGVGIDVCSVSRVQESLRRFGDRIWTRVLSEAERGDLDDRADRATALAGRFAAKEALVKAMAGAPGVGFHDLEVRGAPRRPPRVLLRGPAEALARAMGVRSVHLSITHDAGVAAAVAILEGDPAGGGACCAPAGGAPAGGAPAGGAPAGKKGEGA